MFINVTDAPPLGEFDGNTTMYWYLYYGSTFHTENPISYLNNYNHYYEPQIGIKVPGMEVSGFIDLDGPIEELFPLTHPEIEQCTWGGSTLIKVPVDIYLLSPHLYHLGTTVMYSEIYLEIYNQSAYLYNYLSIETNAGKKNMQFQCAFQL